MRCLFLLILAKNSICFCCLNRNLCRILKMDTPGQINEDLIQKFAAQIIEKSFADLQDEAQSATFSTTSTLSSSPSLEPTSATVTTDTSKSTTTSDFTAGGFSPQISDSRVAESSIFENRSFNLAEDSMTSFATPSTKSGLDSSTKDKFESFLEKTVTDLLDDFYQSPENEEENEKIENFYKKLEEEEKETKTTKFKNQEEEENQEQKIVNFTNTAQSSSNNNNATVAALQLASYPPTPPNSFLNTPKLASDADAASTAFEPEKVGQKLR
uniref:Uncharacterized protein n=1 Tax=Romanomermis culicivorax TaxID=13658 RepID=A0A915IJ50_ROMCU